MNEYMDIDLSEHLSIELNKELQPCVAYKGLSLWRTGVGLDKLKIRIYDPTKKKYEDDPDYYLLECEDNLGDHFYYGRFNTILELEEFLEDPVSYHQRQEMLMELFFRNGGLND